MKIVRIVTTGLRQLIKNEDRGSQASDVFQSDGCRR